MGTHIEKSEYKRVCHCCGKEIKPYIYHFRKYYFIRRYKYFKNICILCKIKNNKGKMNWLDDLKTIKMELLDGNKGK